MMEYISSKKSEPFCFLNFNYDFEYFKYRNVPITKTYLFFYLVFRHHNHQYILGNNSTMSKEFLEELDYKMQQVREYELIAHSYRNENIQYPVHVRRSHDGEKLSRTSSKKLHGDHRKNNFSNTTILTPSSHDNLTKVKPKETITRHLSYDEQQTVITPPPNKTVNDIDPSFNCDKYHKNRKCSLSPKTSSQIYCSLRPFSIASLSLSSSCSSSSSSDDPHVNSCQTLTNQTVPTKTLRQRFFSKFFNPSSKS